MTDEISRGSTGGLSLAGVARSPARYLITRTELIDHDGNRTFDQKEYEVSDLEAYRKKRKGDKYADVFLVYTTIWTE